jgi:dethiobiotin synthetase
VGKTYVTASLRKQLRNAIALKPIESGYAEEGSDARTIEGENWTRPLYCFDQPLSPHLVARDCGVHISAAEIRSWLADRAARARRDLVLMETAGGLLSPLDDEGLDNLGLIRAVGAEAWVLVAPNRLGVLHDVRAALVAAHAVDAPPVAIVLSEVTSDQSSFSNATELSRLTPVPVFVVAPSAPVPEGLLQLLCCDPGGPA